MTTAEQPAPRRRPAGRPGLSWSGDGALAREVNPGAVSPPAALARTSPARALPEPEIDAAMLAGVGRRAAGYAIDLVILALVGQVVGLLLGAGQSGDLFVIDEAFARFALANSIVRFGYNWYFNTRGWSPGKRAVGIRLVTAGGDAPGARRGFTRAAAAVLSETVLWVGYAWAAWDARNQTWHDKAAGTYAVVDGRYAAGRRDARRDAGHGRAREDGARDAAGDRGEPGDTAKDTRSARSAPRGR